MRGRESCNIVILEDRGLEVGRGNGMANGVYLGEIRISGN